MKNFLKIFVCVMILGIFSSASADSEADKIFRETVEKTSKPDTRYLRADILFIAPSFQGELEFIGSADENSFKSAGNFAFWLTDDTGSTTEADIPFYLTQNEKDMQLYFQADKDWSKIQAPILAAAVTDIVATPTKKETEDLMDDVKEVVILQETDSRRILLVKLDGNKIADFFKEENAKNPVEVAPTEIQQNPESFLNYVDEGMRNADIWYTWTVDKNSWQTVTMSFNLSSLPQSIARAALMDGTKEWNELERSILETVAYYSEMKGYLTYLNDEAAKKLEIPKKVLKAKEVKGVISDKK